MQFVIIEMGLNYTKCRHPPLQPWPISLQADHSPRSARATNISSFTTPAVLRNIGTNVLYGVVQPEGEEGQDRIYRPANRQENKQ